MKNRTIYCTIVCSLLLMTACQPKEKTEEKTEEKVTHVQSSTYSITTQSLGGILQETMPIFLHVANKFAIEKKQTPPATDEQIKCFASSHNDRLLAKLEEYLKSQFTEQEFVQLNQYFSSPAGEQQINMAKKGVIAILEEKNPELDDFPSQEAQEQIKKFSESELGRKLQQVLENEAEINKYMEQVLKDKLKDCGINDTSLDKFKS